jgi:hypothetical protein
MCFGDAVQFAYFLVAVMRWQPQAMVLSFAKAAVFEVEVREKVKLCRCLKIGDFGEERGM